MNRDYFLGGNTNKGFFSYYNYLADAEKIRKVYIIKGGPGTGKSTTMKMLAKWGSQNGFDVDLIHCSSDPGSLDGVLIKQIGVAMVDGTAPHIVDPQNAGAVESIVNMGEFWDESAIMSNKKEIMECTKEISDKFRCAYNFLEAAGSIHRNCHIFPEKKKAENCVTEIMESLPKPSEINCGKVRKLFAEAITPEGVISYADGLCAGKRVVLKSELFGGGYGIMESLAAKLKDCGFDTELFYSPLAPESGIRHIVLPNDNICIMTSDILSQVNEKNAVVKDIDEMVEEGKINPGFLRSRLLVISIIQQAVQSICAAKKLHDKLEEFYVPNTNFDAMNKKREKIIDDVSKLAQMN